MAKPSSNDAPLDGFVRPTAIAAALQMNFSNKSRGPKVGTPKPRTPPSDLAEQFLELQVLRRKVHELEKLVGERDSLGSL